MTAYYNELDPYAAQWLRNLIAAGHIADGVVDERSIEDVRPSDLKGFTQCHFFAGIGVWSYALRNAGLSDDRPVWTGSCPCQPFSSAGAGAGFADERHLWPAFFHLIQECKPAVVFGEQVASKDANPWIDLVQTDLEAVGYGVGAIAFPAAGIGAPHIRDRLYWVAYANFSGRQPQPDAERARVQCEVATTRPTREQLSDDSAGISGGMADSEGAGKLGVIRDAGGESAVELRSQQERVKYDCGGWLGGMADASGERVRAEGLAAHGATAQGMCGTDGQRERLWIDAGASSTNGADRMADTKQHSGGCQAATANHIGTQAYRPADQHGGYSSASTAGASPTNGFWADADWLLCRDGRWRPVEPGTFPLAHGIANRVGRLRAYGNAICASQAKIFIEAAMSHQP